MKNNDDVTRSQREPQLQCPSCESDRVLTTLQDDSFAYGEGDEAITLTARVRVHSCENCGLQFTDDDAATARHEAVCHHLGVMTPGEIQALREGYDMSRSEFSRLTRIGEASLGRWENGLLIQNHAYDHFLYLLKFPENIARLRSRNDSCSASPARPVIDSESAGRPRLRLLREVPSRLAHEADVFVLRPAVATAGAS